MLRITSLLVLLTFFSSCESKLGKFEEDLLFSVATNDSVQKLLQELDTNQLLKLRGKSKMMLLNFNIELGNDTLDIETAHEIDGFIQSYRATDFFTTEIRQLRIAQQEQRKRLQKLQADIENDAGDRSAYFENVQLERKEVEVIRKHSLILEKQFIDFKQSYEQFKPTFERFKVVH
ncbi:hypothetical protein [Fluviicola taffensis]|uniref:Lipoprotein n=1 Tax=Fluviicola taffensis (strain DSM 16823 / NCIMB 13979 / RW262) TaxID=755732 RepID=F2IJQ2_FLUTR|nr:hypothetical protein [Fluviicola taffensis]AEA43942.1 hypothetical protein Fluta_1955 [Fluviicola taffensis DSM 16823]